MVNKVNPQNIIINSAKVGQISDLGGKSTSVDLGAGTFILITLLAVGINIVGFVIFLSIGLVFVVRVVGLWIAMILSPLAFFTYILPEQMAGWKMVGWKNWWPETLKMAFMAPIFIFFWQDRNTFCDFHHDSFCFYYGSNDESKEDSCRYVWGNGKCRI